MCEPVCDLFWNKKSFSRKHINHDVHHRIKLLGFRILEPQISWVLSFFENELVRYKNWKVKEKLMRAILFNFEWGDINVVNFGRFLTKAFFDEKLVESIFRPTLSQLFRNRHFFDTVVKYVFLSRNFWWKFFFSKLARFWYEIKSGKSADSKIGVSIRSSSLHRSTTRFTATISYCKGRLISGSTSGNNENGFSGYRVAQGEKLGRLSI